MPKVTKTNIGSVYLREIEPRKWRASWTDPLTKRHVRRILPAATYRDAEQQAQEINRQLAQGKGFGGRLRGSAGHTVSDAVLEAVRHSGANESTRQNYLHRFNAFADYLARNAKAVQSWASVSEEIVANYLEHCRRGGLAYDTIRMRLYVLRLTSDFMSRTYPGIYRHVTRGVKFKRAAPSKADLEESAAIFNPAGLRAFLAWLRKNEPMIHVWATAQGLCGLRLFEILYLREQDFDAKNRTLTITERSVHRPKNRPSHRRIPICRETAAVLGDWIAALRIRHAEGYVFTPQRSINLKAARSPEARVGVYTKSHASHRWGDALMRARLAGLAIPEKLTPRKLRSSFITAMRKAGVDFPTLQKYVGHAPGSVLSAHYDEIDLDRLRAISNVAQGLFEASGFFAEGLNRGEKTGG